MLPKSNFCFIMVKVADLIVEKGGQPARLRADVQVILGCVRPHLYQQCEAVRTADAIRELLGDFTVEKLIEAAEAEYLPTADESLAKLLTGKIAKIRQNVLKTTADK